MTSPISVIDLAFVLSANSHVREPKSRELVCLCFNTGNLSKEAFDNKLKDLSLHDQTRVLKFRSFDDQRRALLSALLQRKIIHDTFKLSDNEYTIARTHEVSHTDRIESTVTLIRCLKLRVNLT